MIEVLLVKFSEMCEVNVWCEFGRQINCFLQLVCTYLQQFDESEGKIKQNVFMCKLFL